LKIHFFKFVILGFWGCQVLSIPCLAQNEHPKFVHLSTNEGLSQGHVSAILKDSKGFMWFATEDGLDRYDGYNFTIYRSDPENPASINNNFINDVFEDHSGDLWIGTASGLDKFDRGKDNFIHFLRGSSLIINDIFEDSRERIWLGTTTGLYLFNKVNGQFTRYKHQGDVATSLSDDFIYQIAEDNKNDLWIATKNGLNRLDQATGIFTSYKNDPANNKSIGGNWIKTVYKDRRGNIWIGTQGNGIAVFQPEDNSFINFRNEPGNSKSISHNDILSFAEDNAGNLWVGTENGGISLFNYATHDFSCYQTIPNDNTSLNNNSIHSLYKDDIGNMWVGTWSGGVNFIPRYGDKFSYYKEIHAEGSSGSSSILSIAGSGDGNVWFGTDGGGLNCFHPIDHSFTQFRHDSKNKNSISGDYINSIVEVRPGLLGLGFHRGGFDLFNIKTGISTHYVPEQNNPNSLSELSVTALFKDHEGRVWLGTWGGGLNLFDPEKNTFRRYQNDPADSSTLGNNFIHSILEDRDGNLWIGTDISLDLFDRKSQRFYHFIHQAGNKQTLSNDMVESMLEDHAGNIWIGTREGLNLFDRKSKTFSTYTVKDGFANNTIRSILADRRGNLWISSNKGVTKFDPMTKTCRNYGISDGLQGNEFKSHCSYVAKDGEMFFGGPNGFNAFYPDRIKDNDFVPPIYITDFQIFNKRVKIGDKDDILRSAISETKEMALSYKQSVFTFEFAALNYTLPEKNQYAYKMEGFDKDWNRVGTQRKATYTNLDPGHYVFRVIACNNDGTWNLKGVSISLTVTPPFWATWWFRSVIALLVICSCYSFYRYRMNISEARRRVLEERVVELDKAVAQGKFEIASDVLHDMGNAIVGFGSYLNRIQRLHEQDKPENLEKLAQFFEANFSALVTAIGKEKSAAVIKMIKAMGEAQAKNQAEIGNSITEQLNIVHHIDEILHIQRQYISGKHSQERKPVSFGVLISDCLSMLRSTLEKDAIKISVNVPADLPLIKGDRTKLMQVLLHILKNSIEAIGMQAGERNIIIGAPFAAGRVVVEINDTGEGFEEEFAERLFTKGFTTRAGGAGLGLYNCLDIVESHSGKIYLTSPGKLKGALARIEFPA
jgi:ligand-binding sensor domain-containing protein/signal transduction histidine kinase